MFIITFRIDVIGPTKKTPGCVWKSPLSTNQQNSPKILLLCFPFKSVLWS